MDKSRIFGALLAVLAVFSVPATAQENPAVSDDYKVNAGDILSISVWKEDGLQREVLVRPDGKFSFPLAGDIKAEGNSIEGVRELLTERLSRLIPEAVVSVSAIQINGNKVYVIGQVNRPGEFIANPQVDVLQALAIAGGTTPFAEVNDIRILRRENGELSSMEFRYRDIEKGKRLEQNIVLQAGDVVIVP